MNRPFLLLLSLCLAIGGTIWIYAQTAPQPAPNRLRPQALPTQQDRAEEALRILRQALADPEFQPAPAIPTVPPGEAEIVELPEVEDEEALLPEQELEPELDPAFPPGAPPARPGELPVQPIAPQVPPALPVPQPRPGITPAQPGLPQQPRLTPRMPPAPGQAPALPGQPPPPPRQVLPDLPLDSRVIPAQTFVIQGMDVDQFFDSLYSPISGRTVLRPFQLPGQVTLKAQTDWTREQAIFAMDSVLALNGIAMIPIGDHFVKAVLQTDAAMHGADLVRTPPEELATADHFVTQVVKVQAVPPTEIATILATFTRTPNAVTAFDATQTLVLRDHALNVRRMLEIIETVDVVREPDYQLEIIPIRYGKVTDFYVTMDALVRGTGAPVATTAAPRPTTPVAPGTRTGVGTGARTPVRTGVGLQQPYGGGVGTGRGIYPQQAAAQPVSPGAAQADFTGRLRQILQRASAGPEVQLLEDARIVPDERSNTLVIFAHRRDMEMIKQIVAKMDVLLAQVLIEAIILEVQIGDSQTLGVSMVQHPRQFGSDFTGAGVINNNQPFLSGLTNFPAGSPSGLTYFGRIGNDFDVVINAIARDNNFRVISRPRIQTSHAIPGNFFIGETVPYVTGAFDYGFGGVGAVTRSQIQQIRVGLNLDVVPFITPEGYVVMEIHQDVNALSRDVIIDGNPIPVITERTAAATLTVRDGDTIMMGGFISENKSHSKSGVPVLKDIPGLGALFRTKTSSSDRTELVILLRATVLPSPDAAAYHAQIEKAHLPGVQQAERDFERSESRRFRDIQRR